MIINRHKDLVAAIGKLGKIEPVFAQLAKTINLNDPEILPLRRWPASFAALAKIVVGQQVSTTSASAIYQRLEDECGEITPTAYLNIGEIGWKRAGLSRPKQATLLNIATMINSQKLNLEALGQLGEADARGQLLAIKGIGPWSADLFLLTCVGSADVFPHGDIALQEAAKELFDLKERPDACQLEKFANNWSPYRAVAARLLWAYYRELKQGREGLVS